MLRPRSTRSRATMLAVACGALMAALPAAAMAANPIVVQDGSTLVFDGLDDANNSDFAVAFFDQGADKIALYSPGVTLSNPGACVLTAADDTVRCLKTAISKIEFRGFAGDDDLEAFFNDPLPNPSLTVTIDGGAGGDFLYGGANGATTPTTLIGGPGRDRLFGTDAADSLDGGDDGDRLQGFQGADSFVGGTGFDTVSYDDRDETQPVSASPDGVANDGNGNEGDNIGGDVEDLIGGAGADVLTGSAASNTLTGGDGNDQLSGLDGFDSFDGGDGDDTILARDGHTERIDCGGGADKSNTDTSDTASSCETNDASNALEADVDKDGVTKPADCDDTNPSIHPGATDIPNNGVDEDCAGGDNVKTDADGDGFSPPADCNDANKAINPAAPEIYGNKVDEDCNGRQDPLLAFTSRIINSFKKRSGTFRVASLSILNPPQGATVQMLCSGGKKKGCPFDTTSLAVPAGSRQLRLESKFKKASFKPGALLEIRILRKDAIGRVSQFKITKGFPKETKLCMAPTDPKPRKCTA